MSDYPSILIRATNWVGDAVMCVPALREIRKRFPSAHIAILAKPWVADLYRGADFANEVIVYEPGSRWQTVRELRRRKFAAAILLQNAFDAALITWLAGIPVRIGYNRDLRGMLLTRSVSVPKPGEIPPHQRFYYLELLRRAGIIDKLPDSDAIRLSENIPERRPIIGISPGAAYGTAKRWLPERFAQAAAELARVRKGSIRLFGSKTERELCGQIAALLDGFDVHNYAGETSLAEFIRLASDCELFLTNDSGAMHIASSLGIPTIAVFGATDHIATGPTGPLARVVREPVECSPCLLRECPIDHRCMTNVTVDRVVHEALTLLG